MKIACLILAGGRGTRLWPITYFMHKTLLHLRIGKRVIDYVLESCFPLSNQTKTEIFVLARHKAGQLQHYLGRKFKVLVLVDPDLAE